MSELLNCPFCGAKPILHGPVGVSDEAHQPVECSNPACCMSRLWPDVREWNRRTPSSGGTEAGQNAAPQERRAGEGSLSDRHAGQRGTSPADAAPPARDGLAEKPLESYPIEDQAFYRWWYGHMLNDLMQPPLSNVDHSTARYIWDAALRQGEENHKHQGFYQSLAPSVSRGEWHDVAWALFHAKTFSDTQLSKVNIHTIKAVFDATYDALRQGASR